MKKSLLLLILPLTLLSCQTNDIATVSGTATVRFSLDGFTPIQTRTAIEESDMTDLWLFDFMGDEELQSVHITDMSNISIDMSYGHHRVCFVASRGDSPYVDSSSKTISWSIPRDTFWGSLSINVVPSSNGTSVSVTLNRVATRLRIVITDQVPANISSVSVTPAIWYKGLCYETGEAADAVTEERTVQVPSSYIGTSSLVVNFFGLSDSGEWLTDINVKATDTSGNIIGQSTITDAPFIRNRSTEYSGPLFGSSNAWTILLNDVWESPYNGTW